MKYCTNCGAELFDEAIICVKCGRIVKAQPTYSVQPQYPTDPPIAKHPPMQQEKESVSTPSAASAHKDALSPLQIVSNFIHLLAMAFGTFFLLFSIGFSYVGKYGLILNTSYLPPAIVFYTIAIACGIFSLVATAQKRLGRERLFAGIERIAVALIALVCAIVFLVY